MHVSHRTIPLQGLEMQLSFVEKIELRVKVCDASANLVFASGWNIAKPIARFGQVDRLPLVPQPNPKLSDLMPGLLL